MAFRDFTNLKKRGTFFYFESTITKKIMGFESLYQKSY